MAHLNAGIPSRNHGVPFQKRGTLSRLAPSSASGSGAHTGTAARHVPLPVNTSSLRKESGGQDVTLFVNRGGESCRGYPRYLLCCAVLCFALLHCDISIYSGLIDCLLTRTYTAFFSMFD